MAYFRECHFTQLKQTSAIMDTLSPLLVCYNEGLLFLQITIAVHLSVTLLYGIILKTVMCFFMFDEHFGLLGSSEC
jgi:hypothetical protein